MLATGWNVQLIPPSDLARYVVHLNHAPWRSSGVWQGRSPHASHSQQKHCAELRSFRPARQKRTDSAIAFDLNCWDLCPSTKLARIDQRIISLWAELASPSHLLSWRLSLLDFQPANDFFIGIDSDGCAFDTMEVKHTECFIEHHQVLSPGGSKQVRSEAAEFVICIRCTVARIGSGSCARV